MEGTGATIRNERRSRASMTTFPITINRSGAWFIQQTIRPGVPLGDMMMGTPVYLWQQHARLLREKVNNSIIRFEDEPETENVDIDITPEEAWLLDQNVPMDGTAHESADLLLQIFRGLWGLEHPGLPIKMIQEPLQPSKDTVKDLLDTRWNP